MIEIGVRVKIKKSLSYADWYSPESYTVIDIIRPYADDILVAVLNKKYPSYKKSIVSHNKIALSNLEIDIKYLRERKLKEIFND